MSFKLHTHHYSDTPLPRFFFGPSVHVGNLLAREAINKKMSFWERSGPHPKGGFTSLGVKRRVRFEKEITHPQGALTCTCTRSHMCVPESAHTCAHKNVRAGECAHMRTQNVRAGECAHMRTQKCACRRVRTHACVRMHPAGA